jgi:hypothetical protein
LNITVSGAVPAVADAENAAVGVEFAEAVVAANIATIAVATMTLERRNQSLKTRRVRAVMNLVLAQ